MEKGSASYFLDYSISLDTQALSYLEPFLRGVKSSIPKDFKEVFAFIAREDVNVDPLPYTIENLRNLESPKAADRIYDKLKAYQRLRTLDANWFRTKGEIRSKFSEEEIVKSAQEQIAEMFESLADCKEMSEITFCHQVMYCQLLMMVLIQLREPRLSVSAKLQEYLQFLDSELATIFARETVVAHAFFTRGQKLTFFGKVQIKKPDLFQVLDGMAWDLWHVRQLEKLMTLKPLQNARYFFPALLTFDKRFTEVIDLYPLKSCAFIEGLNEPIPFYDGSWLETITENNDKAADLAEKIYSNEAKLSRKSRRPEAKKKISEIVRKLEKNLAIVARIEG
jgi:hypothetical protein